MARPRKPTVLKLVTGTDRADRRNRREPKPDAKAGSMPAHMTDRGKRAWKRLRPILDKIGVLTAADPVALERLCETYGEVLECQETLKRRADAARVDALADGKVAPVSTTSYETHTIQGGRMIRAYPEVAQLADADRRLRGYLADFGMTPSARSKVQVAGETKDDPAAQYFGGGR